MATYLVTGANGRIGSSVTKNLLDRGHFVYACDFDYSNLSSYLNSNSIFKCHPDDLLEGFWHSDTLKTFPIDGLAHCSYPRSSWIRKANLPDTIEDFINPITSELAPLYQVSKSYLLYAVKRQLGSLVLLSSIQGIAAPKFHHYLGTDMCSPLAYTASKHAIVGISRWFAKYFQNSNIRVNCVSFGGIKDTQPSSFLNSYRASTSNIGMLQPIHISNPICDLLSEQYSAVTGANIIIDDGWSL